MIKEEDVRFKHLEKKIGLFAAIAIVGALAVVLFIGADKDLLTPKYKLKFTTGKGTGFAKGMPVKLSGFRIGRIKSINLNEQAMVDIEIEVNKKYQKWIKSDSSARLVKEGLVGDSIIEVTAGSAKAMVLKNGDTINFEKSKGLEEVANDIAEEVKPVLIEVKEIISYINDPNGDIKQSLGNIKLLTQQLQDTREKVDDLLVSSRDNVSSLTKSGVDVLNNTNAKVSALGPTLEKVDRSMANLEKSLPPLLQKVDASMDHLEKTTLQLQKTSEKAMPRVPKLINKAEDVMEGADTVLNAVKDMWPFKNHVPAADQRQFVPGDSHD
ncbi:ABC transporter, periplasmic substrate-binding protein, MCE family [Geotalea daltonii FRC-32]|uniref:ABC transporter, periplasmic substrate-binding protein, MCE family n=1 Tax=Geotalea daltonii (strain DSM 22248 / JCM 15807 / FRC-32) TaxID=316067 RepID=B9M1F3_GEODF|nr:MlaD family protein [Geotalea daltonii]ACM21035.1 ABC transporter, periplasmic substrate-binding protein, MCE family [Geotalea daltonii FRC-32]